MFWLITLLSCGGVPTPPSEAPPAAAPSPQRAPGTSAAEDLTSSWRPALAVAVPSLTDAAPCPDADGDGFVSALACPGGDPATLDCDDDDPAVTPATERWVRPGPFIMGSASSHAGADEHPVHVVTLAGYCLDRTEVRTDAFSAWLRATGRQPQGADVRGLEADGTLQTGREAYPAEGATWTEAHDYCVARGQALPTEAQWEKAARGGCEAGDDASACDPADLRAYPWGGAAPSCELANHQVTTQGTPHLCHSDTLPVGSLPQGTGPYGHLDLAGNVWEYVTDTWNPRTYGDGGPRQDPGGPSGDDDAPHVLRGGGWNTYSTNMRAANRFHDLVLGSAAGFRCARPTVPARPDAVEPLHLVSLRGQVRRAPGPVTGRALYISVFDAADLDPRTHVLAPGRSPVAEARFTPTGTPALDFEVRVPAGASYVLMAALDDGSGADKQAYKAASGSGGFGEARENPVSADQDVDGLHIELHTPPPGGGPHPVRAPSPGPGAPGPAHPPAGRGPHG